MLRRYAVAWGYLAGLIAGCLVYGQLTAPAQAAFTTWASTSVANLEHEPVGPLVVSAFIAPGYLLLWPVLAALALFGANRALGNARMALVCVAGQVIGSLVSEGIVGYRVDAGQLPVTDRHLVDIGPSYVVVAAIVIALNARYGLHEESGQRNSIRLVFGASWYIGTRTHAERLRAE